MSDEPGSKVSEQAMVVLDQAQGLTVRTKDDWESAGAFLVRIKTLRQRIADVFGPIITKAHQAHKEAIAQRKGVEAPLNEAEKAVKAEMSAWTMEQERIRREEERRIREEQERHFAEERKKAEEERLIRATEAEEQGRHEEADAVLDEPEPTAPLPPLVPRARPVVEGVTVRQVWKYRIVDLNAIPRAYLKVDETKLGQIARALKDKADVPGVEFYAEDSIAARTQS